ncbi:MAG: Cu(I)-responsive transcriptional regulator [Pyrinomonadaceae bacterium]
MERLTIGEVAKQGAVNLETIRYYERFGLLSKPPRSPSGYRVFPTDAVRRVRFIKRAQELGFSLKEIKELLALRSTSSATSADVRHRAEAKISDIEGKIKMLRAMKKALTHLTATCCGDSSISACPILESLDSEKGI